MNIGIKQKIKARLALGVSPDFMIIGAAKCGTTSLFNYLEEYSKNFSAPTIKETRYFSEFNHLPLQFYHSHFSSVRSGVTGEATPDYLFYQKAPRLIASYGKVKKFVILLRDPTKRAMSQYNFQNYVNKSEVCDPLPFSQAIRSWESRYVADENMRFYSEYKHYSYVERGFYYEQMVRWLSLFPRNQFYIMFLEELNENFADEILQLFEFLGLEYNGKPFNQTRYNKSDFSEAPGLKLDDEKFLDDLYKPHNQKLFEFLNKEPIW